LHLGAVVQVGLRHPSPLTGHRGCEPGTEAYSQIRVDPRSKPPDQLPGEAPGAQGPARGSRPQEAGHPPLCGLMPAGRAPPCWTGLSFHARPCTAFPNFYQSRWHSGSASAYWHDQRTRTSSANIRARRRGTTRPSGHERKIYKGPGPRPAPASVIIAVHGIAAVPRRTGSRFSAGVSSAYTLLAAHETTTKKPRDLWDSGAVDASMDGGGAVLTA